MTKLLIISDNHGDKKVMQQIIAREKPDLKIHLGDSQMLESNIFLMFDYYVGGNNDLNFTVEELTFKIEGFKVAICHGHTLKFSYLDQTNMIKSLVQFARQTQAQIVLFGHTHVPLIKEIDDITLINPGSISLPRQGTEKTYAIVKLNRFKIEQITIKKVR